MWLSHSWVRSAVILLSHSWVRSGAVAFVVLHPRMWSEYLDSDMTVFSLFDSFDTIAACFSSHTHTCVTVGSKQM